MPLDRFLIGPLNTGLETDLKPFAIPDDSYPRLKNAYIFRGRLRKRFGSYLMNGSVDESVAPLYSRLRVNIGNTPGPLNLPNPNPALDIGQMFSVGDDMFTVWQLGAGVTTLSTNAGITCTINSVAIPNTVTFVGAPAATPVYWYPALPVMGLITYEKESTNNEDLIAFDTRYAYQYSGGAWQRLATGAATWSGTNSQFFWGYTWTGLTNNVNRLFVTNFNAADRLRYFDGTTWTQLTAQYLSTSVASVIKTARIIVPFKDRLVLLNTVENVGGVDQSFLNRCRFSQNGSPLDASAFYEDVPGKGGYLDAATKEAIITAEFLKDRLIVYFERSTWELVYTGNEILPFRWQQINTELGAESTFSVVPFDKVVLGVGNVGIHACNGINVERIDEKIPDTVFEIQNATGVERVYGIRDYFTELVYWTFPTDQQDETFPRQVLVYNYRTGSWAFNDDSITAFGYYQSEPGLTTTWGDEKSTWEEVTSLWNSATFNNKFRFIVAGNQEGFVFIIDPNEARNSPALQVTNVDASGTFTVINHNLRQGDFVILENAQGIDAYNDFIYQVSSVTDPDTFVIDGIVGTGYLGGGTLARVSQIDIYTKQFNFYASRGQNATVQKVEFLVDRTAQGQIAVDYFASGSNFSLRNAGFVQGSILGTSTLDTFPYTNIYPLEASQDWFWHPVYIQCEGQYVQFRIYLSNDQMVDPNISLEDFQLNSMIIYAQPTSQLR